MSCHPLLEFLLSIPYIDHVTESTPYLVDNVGVPTFTFIGTFSINLSGRKEIAKFIH